MKKHNFSAGPCILPDEVMQQAAQAVQELDGSGLSLIEISHRSAAFIEIMDKACSLALKLLGLTGKGTKPFFYKEAPVPNFWLLPIICWKTRVPISIRELGLQRPSRKQNY